VALPRSSNIFVLIAALFPLTGHPFFIQFTELYLVALGNIKRKLGKCNFNILSGDHAFKQLKVIFTFLASVFQGLFKDRVISRPVGCHIINIVST